MRMRVGPIFCLWFVCSRTHGDISWKEYHCHFGSAAIYAVLLQYTRVILRDKIRLRLNLAHARSLPARSSFPSLSQPVLELTLSHTTYLQLLIKQTLDLPWGPSTGINFRVLSGTLGKYRPNPDPDCSLLLSKIIRYGKVGTGIMKITKIHGRGSKYFFPVCGTGAPPGLALSILRPSFTFVRYAKMPLPGNICSRDSNMFTVVDNAILLSRRWI